MAAPKHLVMDDTDLRRFWAKVALPDTPDGCWVWTGSRNGDGYGNFWLDGKVVRAHRASYATWCGPIPDGHELDHVVCDYPACVNPRHVVPSTHYDNSVRAGVRGVAAIAARKTHCPQGHPLTGDNLDPGGLRRGWRTCLTCKRTQERNRDRERTRERQRAYRERNRERLRERAREYRERNRVLSRRDKEGQ